MMKAKTVASKVRTHITCMDTIIQHPTTLTVLTTEEEADTIVGKRFLDDFTAAYATHTVSIIHHG
jgi:hypothetical protein